MTRLENFIVACVLLFGGMIVGYIGAPKEPAVILTILSVKEPEEGFGIIINTQPLRDAKYTKKWGFRLYLYKWLRDTYPQYHYRLHPNKNVLSVRSKGFFVHHRSPMHITIDKNGQIVVNNPKFTWLAEEIQKKMEEMKNGS